MCWPPSPLIAASSFGPLSDHPSRLATEKMVGQCVHAGRDHIYITMRTSVLPSFSKIVDALAQFRCFGQVNSIQDQAATYDLFDFSVLTVRHLLRTAAEQLAIAIVQGFPTDQLAMCGDPVHPGLPLHQVGLKGFGAGVLHIHTAAEKEYVLAHLCCLLVSCP